MAKKRSITLRGTLRLLGDVGKILLPAGSRKEAWEKIHGLQILSDLEDYFPSVILRSADKLERRGFVEKMETENGLVIKITDKGKTELLKYKFQEMQPKKEKWDGRWRVVFFDVPESEKKKRDELRNFLLQLGMKRMQDSVFVSPYDVSGEVKYLREVLNVPHGVKLGVLEFLENNDELKQLFDL